MPFRFTVRLLRLLNTIYPSCHVPLCTYRHLRGITRVEPSQKSTYSSWNKRATRGYQANYDRDDRRHDWMIMHREDRIRPGAPPETSAAADVEILDERDKNQEMASANNAAGSEADSATMVLVRRCYRRGCHNTATGRTLSLVKQSKWKPQCHIQKECRSE